MKNKILLILILTGIFLAVIVINVFFIDKRNNYGSVKILSSPAATVFINNVAVGKTPYESNHKVGEFILKLIPEGTATHTASFTRKIKINKNSLTYANIELGFSDLTTAGEIFYVSKMESKNQPNTGEIYIETEPEGAIVSLDNDEKGTAPLILENVLKGEHEISVYMPGFFRRTQKVNVTSGYRINSFFKLAIDQSQKSIESVLEEKKATESATKTKFVIIGDTPSGWLRVRTDASLSASESAKVKPGEKYQFLEEKNGWYKIKFNGNKDGLVEGEFDEGWVSSQYSKIEE